MSTTTEAGTELAAPPTTYSEAIAQLDALDKRFRLLARHLDSDASPGLRERIAAVFDQEAAVWRAVPSLTDDREVARQELQWRAMSMAVSHADECAATWREHARRRAASAA